MMPYLPQVQDRDGSLRAQLEVIRAEMGPDTSLADVIRKFIREGIGNYEAKKRLIDQMRDRDPIDKIRAIETLGMTRQYESELARLRAEQDHGDRIKAELAGLDKELKKLARLLSQNLPDAEYESELARLRAGYRSQEAALALVEFELEHLFDQGLSEEDEDAGRARLRAERQKLLVKQNELWSEQDRLQAQINITPNHQQGDSS
jgi:hypothetical protein